MYFLQKSFHLLPVYYLFDSLIIHISDAELFITEDLAWVYFSIYSHSYTAINEFHLSIEWATKIGHLGYIIDLN